MINETAKTLKEKGFVTIKNAIKKEDVDILIQEYEKIWISLLKDSLIKQNPDKPLGSLFPRLRDYHKKNAVISNFLFNSNVFEIVKSAILKEPLLISTSYYFKSPNTPGLPLHQDNYAFGVYPGTTYAAWISLDSSDIENGGLRFVENSHDAPLYEPDVETDDIKYYFSDKGQELNIAQKAKVVDVNTEPGDIIIFNGNIIHGSTKNVSKDRFRRSLICHFAEESVESLALNFNWLYNRYGERVRKEIK